MNNICQSCSIELTNDVLGTNIDGSSSFTYCKFCFENGVFVENITLDELLTATENLYSEEMGITKEEYVSFIKGLLPTLQRWKD